LAFWNTAAVISVATLPLTFLGGAPVPLSMAGCGSKLKKQAATQTNR